MAEIKKIFSHRIAVLAFQHLAWVSDQEHRLSPHTFCVRITHKPTVPMVLCSVLTVAVPPLPLVQRHLWLAKKDTTNIEKLVYLTSSLSTFSIKIELYHFPPFFPSTLPTASILKLIASFLLSIVFIHISIYTCIYIYMYIYTNIHKYIYTSI